MVDLKDGFMSIYVIATRMLFSSSVFDIQRIQIKAAANYSSSKDFPSVDM